uniref:Uncharacterized protein n=1 Tax=Knipowitschia caucasica TaxID=637954 RepID=A0AAV2J2U4_KNICA
MVLGCRSGAERGVCRFLGGVGVVWSDGGGGGSLVTRRESRSCLGGWCLGGGSVFFVSFVVGVLFCVPSGFVRDVCGECGCAAGSGTGWAGVVEGGIRVGRFVCGLCDGPGCGLEALQFIFRVGRMVCGWVFWLARLGWVGWVLGLRVLERMGLVVLGGRFWGGGDLIGGVALVYVRALGFLSGCLLVGVVRVGCWGGGIVDSWGVGGAGPTDGGCDDGGGGTSLDGVCRCVGGGVRGLVASWRGRYGSLGGGGCRVIVGGGSDRQFVGVVQLVCVYLWCVAQW